jgi:GntR family transcriptional regulator
MKKKNNDTFQTLQETLRQWIANTPPGERLPSEPEMARQLNVSRATLREAMRTFEAQGLIRRRQGSGTFVIGQIPVLESGLEVLESIDTLARRKGMDIAISNLSIVPMHNSDYAKKLEVPSDTLLTYVERIVRIDEKPVAWLIDILPADVLAPEELPENFRGSVLDYLLTRGTATQQSRTEVTAIGAPADIAKKLHIQRGDVLLAFQAWLYGNENRILAYSRSYFLPGHFKFHIVRRVSNLPPERF